MKMAAFWFEYHLNLFPGGSGNGLAPNRFQAITWSNADPVYWRICTALGGGGGGGSNMIH